MEFVVRALRGWAVPLVIPVPKAWQAFDREGHVRDHALEEQLRALGREVTRAARQFAAEPPLTTADVAAAEATLQPLTDEGVA